MPKWIEELTKVASTAVYFDATNGHTGTEYPNLPPGKGASSPFPRGAEKGTQG